MQFNGFPLIERKRIIVFVLVSAFVLLPSSLFFTLGAHTASGSKDERGYEAFDVLVDGASLGLIRRRGGLETFLDYSLREYGWTREDLSSILRLRGTAARGSVFRHHDRLRRNLESYLSSHRPAWAIMVGSGEPIVLQTRRAVWKVLQTLQEAYLPDERTGTIDRVEVQILDRIEVRRGSHTADSMQSADNAVRMLLHGTTEEKRYAVRRGDTAWDIARDHDMSLHEMERANPGKNLSRLSIGEELNLIVPKPYVHISTRFRKLTTHRILCRTHVIWDDSMIRTRAVVERQGVHGRLERTEVVQCLNGVVQEQTVVSEEVLAYPVTRIVRRGTRRTPDDRLVASAFLPGGIGIITSPFGVRWGRFHAGIDVGVPVGTPVHAYRAGRVSFAGYRGRLGHLVIIEHPGGLVTCYGHNSRILVVPGQYVSQGQLIARSGNSGYSTGPHVHFEVHEGGRLRDPLVFLRENRP